MSRTSLIGLLGASWLCLACAPEGAAGGGGSTGDTASDAAGAHSFGGAAAGAGPVAPSAAGSGGSTLVQGGAAGSFAGTGGVGAPGGLGGLTGQAGSAGASVTLDPGTDGDGEVTVGPTYPDGPPPELTDRGAPRGRTFDFSMSSAESAFYKGDDVTLNTPKAFKRAIRVYVPKAYKDGTAAPILVIHDGPAQIGLVSRALDNLTISDDPKRRLPAFIAIAVANGGGDSKGSERGLEYDTMSDRFVRFIEEEVLPAVLSNADIKAAFPGIAFAKDPQARATMGCSSGGAAALTMGWFRPDLFGRIITYSGTFVDQQDDDAPEEKTYPLGAWEYHSSKQLIANSDKKPLRIFLHASENDNGAGSPESGHHNWVMANDRTRDALKAKGYHYRHLTALGAGHCDNRAIQATLADTLVWAWRGYSN